MLESLTHYITGTNSAILSRIIPSKPFDIVWPQPDTPSLIGREILEHVSFKTKYFPKVFEMTNIHDTEFIPRHKMKKQNWW